MWRPDQVFPTKKVSRGRMVRTLAAWVSSLDNGADMATLSTGCGSSQRRAFTYYNQNAGNPISAELDRLPGWRGPSFYLYLVKHGELHDEDAMFTRVHTYEVLRVTWQV
jgi:hypothetical protein